VLKTYLVFVSLARSEEHAAFGVLAIAQYGVFEAPVARRLERLLQMLRTVA